MTLFFFLRYMLVSILLIGWILFQAFIKKKKWVELKNDALAVSFFAGVWVVIAYLFTT